MTTFATSGYDGDSIKESMKLYGDIDRVFNDLEEEGFPQDSCEKIPMNVMSRCDCYDYTGGKDLPSVFETLELNTESFVLDIGAGLGGPGRYLSNQTGCCVIGVELQSDIAQIANTLTARCDMKQGNVLVINGNFSDETLNLSPGPTENGSYDAAFSILVILHVAKSMREPLLQRCFNLLKPGGVVYFEDFFRKDNHEFTEEEASLLRKEVSVPDGGDLITQSEYIEQLRNVGFTDIDFQDVSEDWKSFTTERLQLWQQQKERHVRVYNEVTWESLNTFYSSVVALFNGGTLGGVKLKMTKPIN